MDKAAPVKGRVVLAALLAAVLLALGVTALQVYNARSLRGTLAAEALSPAEKPWVPRVELVEKQGNLVRIRGALMRPGEEVGAVNVRLGLLAGEDVILLNTQMVRRPDLAEAFGCDDHCGVTALADVRKILDGTYQLVFVDEGTTLFETGRTLTFPLTQENMQEAAYE